MELELYDVVYTTERMLFVESKKLKGLAKLKDPRESGWLAFGIGILAYETARTLAEKFTTEREYHVEALDAMVAQLNGQALRYDAVSVLEIVRLRRLLSAVLFADLSVPHVIRIAGVNPSGSRLVIEAMDASPVDVVKQYLTKVPFKQPPTFIDTTA